MKTKLLPCPFCGGDAELKDIGREGVYGHIEDWCVACKKCGIHVYSPSERGKTNTKDAAKAWNRRQSVSGTLEEIRRIICNAYCKQPDIWDDKKEGVELVDSEICGNCALNLL
jgi:Lar family restriction alleviation protein